MRDLKRNTVGSNAPSAKIKERMINDLSSYSSETILLIDLKGKINFATDFAENVLGIKRENLVGKSIYRFSWGKKFLPPEHLGSIKSPIYNKSLQFELVDKRNGSKLIELSCFHHKKSRSKEKEIVLRFRINDKKIKNERT